VGPVYLDTSALVKLVVDEPESSALRVMLESTPRRVSSELTVVELLRAVRRRDPGGELELERLAADVLETVSLYAMTRGLLVEAALLGPVKLRSLDAIHVATALHLRDQLNAVISYDHRLAVAAEAHGLQVLAPAEEPEPETPPSAPDV
jgi:predicted nucleic acid-binding protein